MIRDDLTEVSTTDVAERFFALTKAARAEANRGLRERGFTFARGKLLLMLRERGPMRLSALATAVTITPRSATQAVDALERDRLITRDPDPLDRRAVLVTLTDDGVAVVRDVEDHRRHAVDRIFGVLDDEQRVTLVDLLDTLLAASA